MDEVFFARLRSDALDRGVAGDEIVELGLDDSVVTVDVGDANAAVCLDAFLDKLAAVLVPIFLALWRRSLDCGESWERLGDAPGKSDAGDFRFEDTFLEDDLGDAACSTDAGDFRLDDTFMEDNLLTTRGGDVMELVDAGADALDFDFFFFIVESQIYESCCCLLRRLWVLSKICCMMPGRRQPK